MQLKYFKQNNVLITSRSYEIVYMLLTFTLFLFALRKGATKQFKILQRDNSIAKYLVKTLCLISIVTMSASVLTSYSVVGLLLNQLFNNLLQMSTFLFIIIVLYSCFNLVIDYFTGRKII